jgi:hypothetical protein
MHIQLRIVRFDEWKGRYTCISYAWGGLERTEPVMVDGCHHGVTQNLLVILQRLRLRGILQDIWIDALCIDQNDLEMSYQVGMMAEIYTNAKEVYIGIETDHHSDHRDLASTVFRGLMENRHLNEFTLNRCSWASLHDQFKSFYQLIVLRIG